MWPSHVRHSFSALGRHSVLDTESSRAFWIPASASMTYLRQAAAANPQRIHELFRYRAVSTTMIYTHVLNRGGRGVRSPVDVLPGS